MVSQQSHKNPNKKFVKSSDKKWLVRCNFTKFIVHGNFLMAIILSQIKLMKENCVEVSEHDKVIKPISKMDCHLMKNGPPLHRAFSLFLFNSKNELLLQRRADSKITFPGWELDIILLAIFDYFVASSPCIH